MTGRHGRSSSATVASYPAGGNDQQSSRGCCGHGVGRARVGPAPESQCRADGRGDGSNDGERGGENTLKGADTGFAAKQLFSPFGAPSSTTSRPHFPRRRHPTTAADNHRSLHLTGAKPPHHRQTSTQPLCVPHTHPPVTGQPTHVAPTARRRRVRPAAGDTPATKPRHLATQKILVESPQAVSLLRRSRKQKKYKQQSCRSVLTTPIACA